MLCYGTSLVVRNKGILLRGKPGSGKSDLALRLMHQGAVLISDDQTDITLSDHKQLILSGPKTLQGKLEVRGIGILNMPFCKKHTLDILIDLKNWQDIDRLPEKTFEDIKGTVCPLYHIDPFEFSAVEKVFALCAL